MQPTNGLSGPSGTVLIDGETYLILEWSILEGNPGSAQECDGWFRCMDQKFTYQEGVSVRLDVSLWSGEERRFDGTITADISERDLWRFRAA
jgi:hypothetical protein